MSNTGKIDGQPAAGKVQGEGDYEAARRYRDEVKEFLDNSDIEQLAREAAPGSAQQAQDLDQAEQQGKSRSKGDDPADADIMGKP